MNNDNILSRSPVFSSHTSLNALSPPVPVLHHPLTFSSLARASKLSNIAFLVLVSNTSLASSDGVITYSCPFSIIVYIIVVSLNFPSLNAEYTFATPSAVNPPFDPSARLLSSRPAFLYSVISNPNPSKYSMNFVNLCSFPVLSFFCE